LHEFVSTILFHEAGSRGTAMLMRILETNAGHRRHLESGFSLIEMIAVVGLVPAVKSQHVINAYNTTLSSLRQARDNAVAQSTSYSVTFSNATTPNTITVAPALAGGVATFAGDQSTVTYQLPNDVTFSAASALASTPPPDHFGSGLNAIDFGYTANGNAGGTTTSVIYFCPDGSAQVALTCAGGGNWDNGVVYLAQSGNLLSSRAVDVWGGTGRIHGWRFYSNGSGGYQWVRQ
jgi:Tfp pilus assembly protein FimT